MVDETPQSVPDTPPGLETTPAENYHPAEGALPPVLPPSPEGAFANDSPPGTATSPEAPPGSATPAPCIGAPAPEDTAAEPQAATAPVPRKMPEWKVLEPEDRSDPVPHEVWEHQKRNEQWGLLAASLRGKLHAHNGGWRDDAFGHGATDDWTYLVVADGAGGSRLSRVGARMACDEAVRVLGELLAGYHLGAAAGDTPPQGDLVRVRAFLSEAARKAQLAIRREAQRRNCQVRDLSATFLLALHCPWHGRDFVAAMQLGDGAIALFLDSGACALLGQADQGEYSGETRFLTTPGIEHEFDARVRFCCKKGARCLAVLCDGVADDFSPEDRYLVELFTGDPVTGLKTRGGAPVYGVLADVLKEPEPGPALLDWLRYEKKGSSDDRTLVLLYRREGP